MELRKGEDEDGGNGWHNMSVVIMSLSQYVSRCDRASLSGEIGMALASTWFVHLVSGLPGPVSILRLGVLFS